MLAESCSFVARKTKMCGDRERGPTEVVFGNHVGMESLNRKCGMTVFSRAKALGWLCGLVTVGHLQKATVVSSGRREVGFLPLPPSVPCHTVDPSNLLLNLDMASRSSV